eukprot:TRINITY_DN73152_c0_g1_i1.p1 TRINITY_DN73152_c0_g1~~TRINITY_DN73152_c0_g1_i1.p1  ORF type:complete len:236 (+),score=42.67 TRINITY_DN73152_c0_g1_i1:146-853(+)
MSGSGPDDGAYHVSLLEENSDGGFSRLSVEFSMEDLARAYELACDDEDPPPVEIMEREEAQSQLQALNTEPTLQQLNKLSRGGDIETLRLCLYAGVRDRPDERGLYRTSLDRCGQFGTTECVRELVKWGGNPLFQVNREKRTAISYAAMGGKIDTLVYFAKLGHPMDKPDGDGYTPLLHAVKGGHLHCSVFLLELGADIKHKAQDGMTALTMVNSKVKNPALKAFIKQRVRAKKK